MDQGRRDVRVAPVCLMIAGNQGVGRSSLYYAISNRDQVRSPPMIRDFTFGTRLVTTMDLDIDLSVHVLSLEFDTDYVFKIFRPLLKSTDALLLLYSCVDYKSFEELEGKWIPELRSHNPDSLIFLIGTKNDREDEIEVTEEDVKKLVLKLGLVGQMRVSAFQFADTNGAQGNVWVMVKEVVRSVLETKGEIEQAKPCCILA